MMHSPKNESLKKSDSSQLILYLILTKTKDQHSRKTYPQKDTKGEKCFKL